MTSQEAAAPPQAGPSSSAPPKPRRNRPGSRRSEFNSFLKQPDLDLATSDGMLAAQMLLSRKLALSRHDVDALCKLPEGQDEAVFVYEHLRAFTSELNELVCVLDGVCRQVTCPLMKATDEWLYLCAAHKNPQECCAIDYIIHTIDGTAALLNSNRWFASRVSIIPSSMQYYQSIARRLYRVFAHAYYHHPQVYEPFEAETRLGARFVRLCETYNLMTPKMFIIPNSFFFPPNSSGPSSSSSAAAPAAATAGPSSASNLPPIAVPAQSSSSPPRPGAFQSYTAGPVTPIHTRPADGGAAQAAAASGPPSLEMPSSLRAASASAAATAASTAAAAAAVAPPPSDGALAPAAAAQEEPSAGPPEQAAAPPLPAPPETPEAAAPEEPNGADGAAAGDGDGEGEGGGDATPEPLPAEAPPAPAPEPLEPSGAERSEGPQEQEQAA
eukprot:tig00000350_g24310.t1